MRNRKRVVTGRLLNGLLFWVCLSVLATGAAALPIGPSWPLWLLWFAWAAAGPLIQCYLLWPGRRTPLWHLALSVAAGGLPVAMGGNMATSVLQAEGGPFLSVLLPACVLLLVPAYTWWVIAWRIARERETDTALAASERREDPEDTS